MTIYSMGVEQIEPEATINQTNQFFRAKITLL